MEFNFWERIQGSKLRDTTGLKVCILLSHLIDNMAKVELEVDNNVPETGRLPALLLLSTTGFQSLILYISPSHLFVSRKLITFSSPLMFWNFTVMCCGLNWFSSIMLYTQRTLSIWRTFFPGKFSWFISWLFLSHCFFFSLRASFSGK